MNDSDFDDFNEIWNAAYEAVSRGKTPSAGATNIAFEALREYSLEQISMALTKHVKSPDTGRYGLTPADIVLQIDGPKPTTDQIIAAAMKPRTALAVLCRMEIGTWNLDNWDRFKLAPLAESCIAQIPEWKQRIETGKLTDHESMALTKYSVEAHANHLTAPVRQIGQNNC